MLPHFNSEEEQSQYIQDMTNAILDVGDEVRSEIHRQRISIAVANAKSIEQGVMNILRTNYNQQDIRSHVACSVGYADIVTERFICEVKKELNRKALFEAVGQVLLYRQCISTDLIPIIAGIPDDKDFCYAVKEQLSELGIFLMTLRAGD